MDFPLEDTHGSAPTIEMEPPKNDSPLNEKCSYSEAGCSFKIRTAIMDTAGDEMLRPVSETTPEVNSSIGLLPRGLLESPRTLIRATEKAEPSKNLGEVYYL